ncbi:DUF6350 family protein [uncultured Amnibacterium sp.]|uniref:cell division protein PerM n=1 Tax=uncultured Amnibacterium sp. TaxID=1631851 RepID=UPI0035CB08E1
MLPDAPGVAPEQPTRPRPRRVGSLVVGAVDGLLAVALPFAVLVAVAVLAWAGLGTPAAWTPYAGAAADAWLIGHGVDVRFVTAGTAFTVTITALGPALVTALCAVRAGRRAAGTGSPLLAWAAGCVAAGVASGAVLRLGTSAGAQPVAWQAIAWPVLLVALASLGGLRSARPGARPLPAGVRSGLVAVALVLAASAVALTVALLTRFADVIALDEAVGAGPVGGLALTAAQLLAVPTLVVWAAAWLLGAGFALGAGSVSGPFAAQVGPLPALPVLGAVPAEPPSWAAVVVVVPVLAGFAAAVLVRRGGAQIGAVPLGAATGLVAAVCLGGLAALAAGAAGPGRFASVGPDALVVAGLAAVLVGLPAMLGAAVVRPFRAPEEGRRASQ